MGLAQALTPPNPNPDIVGQAHLTEEHTIESLEQMASYSRRIEVVSELASILGVKPHDITITDERLGPVTLGRMFRFPFSYKGFLLWT